MATGWAKEKGKVQGTRATVVQAPGCAMPPIGSLSNDDDDDDGNDNGKNTKGFRACLHGGRGPQIGEVTRYRWSNPPVHIISHMIGGVTRTCYLTYLGSPTSM